MEILDIVNEHDEVTGQAPHEEIYANKHRHRIVHVLVYNDEGKIALQQRGLTESFMPGAWGTSAGGHVHTGETPEVAALRELTEELGITAPLTFLGKSTYFSPSLGMEKVISCYKTTHNGPFTLTEEGESIKFYSPLTITYMKKDGVPFMPEALHVFERYT